VANDAASAVTVGAVDTTTAGAGTCSSNSTNNNDNNGTNKFTQFERDLNSAMETWVASDSSSSTESDDDDDDDDDSDVPQEQQKDNAENEELPAGPTVTRGGPSIRGGGVAHQLRLAAGPQRVLRREQRPMASAPPRPSHPPRSYRGRPRPTASPVPVRDAPTPASQPAVADRPSSQPPVCSEDDSAVRKRRPLQEPLAEYCPAREARRLGVQASGLRYTLSNSMRGDEQLLRDHMKLMQTHLSSKLQLHEDLRRLVDRVSELAATLAARANAVEAPKPTPTPAAAAVVDTSSSNDSALALELAIETAKAV
jgi:hypothetical protein